MLLPRISLPKHIHTHTHPSSKSGALARTCAIHITWHVLWIGDHDRDHRHYTIAAWLAGTSEHPSIGTTELLSIRGPRLQECADSLVSYLAHCARAARYPNPRELDAPLCCSKEATRLIGYIILRSVRCK